MENSEYWRLRGWKAKRIEAERLIYWENVRLRGHCGPLGGLYIPVIFIYKCLHKYVL